MPAGEDPVVRDLFALEPFSCRQYLLSEVKTMPEQRKPKKPEGKSQPRNRRRSRSERTKASITGVLSVNAKGFGFVNVNEGDDIFIPLDNLYTAMDGDRVSAEIVREVPGRKRVGRITTVLEPGIREIVGRFHVKGGVAQVVPTDDRFNRPFDIPQDGIRPTTADVLPAEGELVVVMRGEWVDPANNPQGRIVQILGKPDDPGMDLRVVARNSGLTMEFPGTVDKETASLGALDIKTELGRREDLRDRLCFTIDPESAKDFDDAVSLVQLDNGRFELGVHIADVSHYVREGSALDQEAFDRGTSVYFINAVIPMLPERISNDLCSLRQDEDRLTFSVIMQVDSLGNIHDYRIRESIIRSKRRFSYQEVEDIIHGKENEYGKTIHLMMLLALALRRSREHMGSIDFDIPVPEISLDENGIPFEIRPSERLEANRLVEEFMLAANLTVARHLARHDGDLPPRPFIYRIHEKPDEKTMREFLDLLERLGLNYKIAGDLESEDYRKILDIIENLEYKDFAEKVALRSMTKAIYSTDNIGHFGLAFDAYTHFTSPIRRYADLVVHRLIKTYAAAEPAMEPGGQAVSQDYIATRQKQDVQTLATLRRICDQCSKREIRAVQAEREYTKIKSMEFLAGKIGESYNGVIAGVASFGFFVELTHYLIEGLVHLSELKDDRYEFDKDNYTLTGVTGGKSYRLGDPVRVSIKSVSKDVGPGGVRYSQFSLNIEVPGTS
jgi:ribonuclease R